MKSGVYLSPSGNEIIIIDHSSLIYNTIFYNPKRGESFVFLHFTVLNDIANIWYFLGEL